jgi:hypothetical protein
MGYNGGSSKMVLGNLSITVINFLLFVKFDIGFGTDSVRSITAGYDTSCAILDNSTQAVCWGQRSDWSDSGATTRSGELLLGSSSPFNSGTAVDLGTAGDRIYSITMGESHACAIVENTVECRGVFESGSFGQGSSTTAAYSTPQQIIDEAPAESSKTPHVESVECSITICLAVNPEGTEIGCGGLYAAVVLEPCPNEPDSKTPRHSTVFSTIAHA